MNLALNRIKYTISYLKLVEYKSRKFYSIFLKIKIIE